MLTRYKTSTAEFDALEEDRTRIKKTADGSVTQDGACSGISVAPSDRSSPQQDGPWQRPPPIISGEPSTAKMSWPPGPGEGEAGDDVPPPNPPALALSSTN